MSLIGSEPFGKDTYPGGRNSRPPTRKRKRPYGVAVKGYDMFGAGGGKRIGPPPKRGKKKTKKPPLPPIFQQAAMRAVGRKGS